MFGSTGRGNWPLLASFRRSTYIQYPPDDQSCIRSPSLLGWLPMGSPHSFHMGWEPAICSIYYCSCQPMILAEIRALSRPPMQMKISSGVSQSHKGDESDESIEIVQYPLVAYIDSRPIFTPPAFLYLLQVILVLRPKPLTKMRFTVRTGSEPVLCTTSCQEP